MILPVCLNNGDAVLQSYFYPFQVISPERGFIKYCNYTSLYKSVSMYIIQFKVTLT